ncbi:MAG TPA: right-handed parallel beta-helix repeat-containing protein [bacterium]
MKKLSPEYFIGESFLFIVLTIFIWCIDCEKSTIEKGLRLRIECTESALRAAFDSVVAAGGGTITFNVSDTTILIDDRIYFYGNNMTLDGEDRNLVLKYVGPDSCNQIEGQDHFIEIHGDNNVLRNLTLIGFPDGIHVQSGYDNIVENVKFPIVCEDAITNNGRGFEAFRTIIRKCYFENSEDKAVMINNGGSATVEDCEFVDCMQPVRAGGRSGHYVVRNCIFRGRSTGPRFSGGKDGMTVIFENNTIHDARYGIRVYGYVQAIIRNNIFRPSDFGVYAYDSASVWLERNDIQDASGVGVLLKGLVQADLGGGNVRINENTTSSLGFNILKGNQARNLVNQTNNMIMAKNNIWDHATVTEILSQDVSGSVDVMLLGKSEGTFDIKSKN